MKFDYDISYSTYGDPSIIREHTEKVLANIESLESSIEKLKTNIENIEGRLEDIDEYNDLDGVIADKEQLILYECELLSLIEELGFEKDALHDLNLRINANDPCQ